MKEPMQDAAPMARLAETEGPNWTFVLERLLRHPPERVWQAITDPAELARWAPFDADGNLGIAGSAVTLTTAGTPSSYAQVTRVRRAEPPHLLEYDWGDNALHWELEDYAGGTRLRLWASIDRQYIAMGAAGWHRCFEVLEEALDGHPVSRLAGPAAMQDDAWKRLHAEYARLFGKAQPPRSG